MSKGEKEISFLWLIENYSYCWHKNGEYLMSPYFTAEGLLDNFWYVMLYPKGENEKYKGNISVFISRTVINEGSADFPQKYELSIVKANGSILDSKVRNETSSMLDGWPEFVDFNKVHFRRKAEYLHQDTLRLLCKIRVCNGNTQHVTQIRARTTIQIHHLSFSSMLEGFSTLEPNQKKTVYFPVDVETSISSSVYFTDGSCGDGEVMVEITPSEDLIVLKLQIYLLSASGIMVKSAEADYRFDTANEDTCKLPLSITRKSILERKREFLPENKLSLVCECTFSNYRESGRTESTVYNMPSTVLNQISYLDQNEEADIPSVLDSLKILYSSKFLTDVELKTDTKTFPAHKIVLCARSPVLKNMLGKDIKKNTNCIKVDDLPDDTVQQLLHYLYSDNIDDLHWESANQLYYAAVKYEIKKLKMICLNFLADNLSSSTASGLLLLAERHRDISLRKIAEDFILEHEEEVYGSNEWENLMETNPQLVMKTMHLKYKKKQAIN